jgi:hypothetical protein
MIELDLSADRPGEVATRRRRPTSLVEASPSADVWCSGLDFH